MVIARAGCVVARFNKLISMKVIKKSRGINVTTLSILLFLGMVVLTVTNFNNKKEIEKIKKEVEDFSKKQETSIQQKIMISTLSSEEAQEIKPIYIGGYIEGIVMKRETNFILIKGIETPVKSWVGFKEGKEGPPCIYENKENVDKIVKVFVSPQVRILKESGTWNSRQKIPAVLEDIKTGDIVLITFKDPQFFRADEENIIEEHKLTEILIRSKSIRQFFYQQYPLCSDLGP
jgi:hypothetical protein